MLRIDLKGGKLFAAAFIELSKKLYKLQAVGMHVGPQSIDADIERMPYKKNNCKRQYADPSAKHGADLVENLCNDAGRQAKRQQS